MSCGGCNNATSLLGFEQYSFIKSYAQNDLVQFGDLVYQSLADGNLNHTPNLSPSYWNPTSVALLLIELLNENAGVFVFKWPLWVSGGGSGPSGDYMMNEAVNYNGQNYISLVDNNSDNPEGSLNWQRFAMNGPGE